MKKHVLAPLSMLALAGCVEARTYHLSETREYELLAARPPKHMVVDLRDVGTGIVFRGVAVSRHCGNHRQRAVVGHVYRLSSRAWSAADGRQGREFSGLHEVFCR